MEMHHYHQPHQHLTLLLNLLILLSTLPPAVTAATSSSIFCKCTCATNSTLIPISGSAPSCGECNRQFCLKQHLPICRDVGDEVIFTTCFQRDSAKDRAVVYLFITATVSLLIYALVKPWARGWITRWRGGAGLEEYSPLPTA